MKINIYIKILMVFYIIVSFIIVKEQQKEIIDLKASKDTWYQEQIEKWIPPGISTTYVKKPGLHKIKTLKFKKDIDKGFKVIYIPIRN